MISGKVMCIEVLIGYLFHFLLFYFNTKTYIHSNNTEMQEHEKFNIEHFLDFI